VQSGCEEQIELLLRRWSRAKSGEGQVVLLSGKPGIGNHGWRPLFWKALNRTQNCSGD
jgi:hypothetical protein